MTLLHRTLGSLLALTLTASAFGKNPSLLRITDLGAKPDGKTLCTDAIAHAIEQLASSGGGTVEIPRGTFLTGPIRFQSNITLQLDEGAVLKFATDPSLYPLVKTRYEAVDIMNYSPLIYAYHCQNIKITGKGTLDGQGPVWWNWARSFAQKKSDSSVQSQPGGHSGQGVGGSADSRNLMLLYTNDREGKYPIEQRVFGDQHPGFRPCFIETYECKNVDIEGVTLRESPFWNLHPLYSQDVTIRNVTVFGDGPNTDGCDPDSCKNVLIEGCHFSTGDDCIAIKSGRDGDGLRVHRPCENITVRNCTMTNGHGAIAIGSETSGGIRHVLAEDCTVDGADAGIRVKSTRGRGGVEEDFTFRRIHIKSADRVGITLNLRYANPKDTSTAPRSDTTPVFRDIHIEDVTCDNAPQAMLVVGLPESHIENFTLKNVTLHGKKGASVEYVDGFKRENVTVTADHGDAWQLEHVHEVK